MSYFRTINQLMLIRFKSIQTKYALPEENLPALILRKITER